MKDGVRYHHILDPATGQPARLCRSVTIAADSPVLADALAKGVFILGPEKGMNTPFASASAMTRALGDERDAAAAARGLAVAQIEDVVVAAAVLHEEALVVA